MILVFVGEQERVQCLDPFAQHLLPEIGPGVNDQALAANLQMNRHP
jgi:hypothetical protein